MEKEIEIVKRLMKETRENSDNGILSLKYIKTKNSGKIFLITEKQLKQKPVLNL